MPKILFIVSTLKRCGPLVQIFNIVRNINPKKFELHLITLSPEGTESMIEKFREFNINIQSLNLSRIKGLVSGKAKLISLTRKINPDIIHTTGFRADKYSLLFLNEYHLISSMQNYPFYDYPMKFGLIIGHVMAKKQLSIVKRCKNFIACSKSVSDLFHTRNNVDLDYIQNAVDEDFYKSIKEPEKLQVKNKLNLPLDKRIIISVGSLISRKDMKTVIKAFKKCQLKDTLLLIAGDGVEKQQLINLKGNNDDIIFLGDINNVRDYLQASDFFISASHAEGLPNTVLEAMACGLPVILSKISPHTEIFIGSEQYKYFFELKNYNQISEFFNQIITDNYESLSIKMQSIIAKNFTAEVMSKKYQDLYNKVLNDNKLQ